MPDIFNSQTNNQEQKVSSLLPITHPAGIFATYRENPSNITFGAQEPNEKVLLFLRRDFITNVSWITVGVVLFIVPTVFIILAKLMNTTLVTLPGNYSFVLQATYYLFVVIYLFVNFIDWFFNTSLITNLRVMDVDFENIFYKDVSETKLTLVQDVSYKQAGFSETVFDYGDVRIQTAAAVDSFNLAQVPRPQRVVEVVEQLIGKEKEDHA